MWIKVEVVDAAMMFINEKSRINLVKLEKQYEASDPFQIIVEFLVDSLSLSEIIFI